jgi:histone H3/H4
MRRGSWADGTQLEMLRCASVDGVIKARRVVEFGVPESTVYERCRPGGPWQLVLPGTVLLSSGIPTADQLIVAGLVYAGDEAVVSGLEACRRHGIRRGPRADGQLLLLVPHGRQPRSVRHVVIERTRRMPRPTPRSGIPLAPVDRAIADAARRMRSPREVTELMADAVQRGLCTVGQLAAEIDTCQRRGTAVPRRILADVSAGARSAAERDAMALWKRSGLPEPWWNAAVHGLDGRFLGVADGWWDDVGLAWEINSYAWHLLPEDYAREQAKTARFTAAGVPVLPTLPTRLRGDGDAVLEEMRQAYGHAAARPRPKVRAVRVQVAAG